MSERLTILSVHAHPDDEASKGAGTNARYAAEGVHTVLVCATDGAEGDILNPEMEAPEIRENLVAVRREELRRATEIIGYREVIMLGYRDSGMPESDANSHPESFHTAPFEEALGRLVAIIRRTKPQVILTYGDDQKFYPHPDHIRVHDISIAAFDAAGDQARFEWSGPAWQPLKMYYNVWSRKRMLQTHEKFVELGLESPYSEEWLENMRKRADVDEHVTTSIDIYGYQDARRDALIAHRTQVDPNSKFWFGLPPEIAKEIHPFEDYTLGRSVGEPKLPEDDLFAGIRESVRT